MVIEVVKTRLNWAIHARHGIPTFLTRENTLHIRTHIVVLMKTTAEIPLLMVIQFGATLQILNKDMITVIALKVKRIYLNQCKICKKNGH